MDFSLKIVDSLFFTNNLSLLNYMYAHLKISGFNFVVDIKARILKLGQLIGDDELITW